jgi:hypothetical protein
VNMERLQPGVAELGPRAQGAQHVLGRACAGSEGGVRRHRALARVRSAHGHGDDSALDGRQLVQTRNLRPRPLRTARCGGSTVTERDRREPTARLRLRGDGDGEYRETSGALTSNGGPGATRNDNTDATLPRPSARRVGRAAQNSFVCMRFPRSPTGGLEPPTPSLRGVPGCPWWGFRGIQLPTDPLARRSLRHPQPPLQWSEWRSSIRWTRRSSPLLPVYRHGISLESRPDA